jgi:hypothetical protein
VGDVIHRRRIGHKRFDHLKANDPAGCLSHKYLAAWAQALQESSFSLGRPVARKSSVAPFFDHAIEYGGDACRILQVVAAYRPDGYIVRS